MIITVSMQILIEMEPKLMNGIKQSEKLGFLHPY